MVRLVNITVPVRRADEVLKSLQQLQNGGYVQHLMDFTSNNLTHISFKAKDKHVAKVLKDVQSQTAVGIEFGTIDVLVLQLTKPSLEHTAYNPGTLELSQLPEVKPKSSKQRQYRIDERMTMEEISSFIDDGNHLTFNYMALLFMASIMAGCGLLGDSSVSVVASMLVSPLMGPILSMTFGLSVHDFSLIKRGIRNELVGIAISFVTGWIMGLAAAFHYSPEWRSEEITSRGQASGLLYGFVVAVATGIAIVLAISTGGVNVIVGSAISVSLLPPIVCSGICAAMALVYRFVNEDIENATHYGIFSGVSFALFAVNFASVIVTGFCTFRYIKQVHPEDYHTLVKGQLPLDRTTSFSSVDSTSNTTATHQAGQKVQMMHVTTTTSRSTDGSSVSSNGSPTNGTTGAGTTQSPMYSDSDC